MSSAQRQDALIQMSRIDARIADLEAEIAELHAQRERLDSSTKQGNGFVFSARSLRNLEGIHPDLRKVAIRALQLTEIDFVVTEGLRNAKRQRQLVNAGASQTMASSHLIGYAIDVAALLDNRVSWDWPLYHKIADAFKQAADELGVPIVWGGDWNTFPDGPHFELDRSVYK